VGPCGLSVGASTNGFSRGWLGRWRATDPPAQIGRGHGAANKTGLFQGFESATFRFVLHSTPLQSRIGTVSPWVVRFMVARAWMLLMYLIVLQRRTRPGYLPVRTTATATSPLSAARAKLKLAGRSRYIRATCTCNCRRLSSHLSPYSEQPADTRRPAEPTPPCRLYRLWS
jgi:hypothetical protein